MAVGLELDLRPEIVDVAMARKDSFSFGYVCTDRETGDLIDFTGTTILLTVNGKRNGNGSDLFAIAPTNTLAADGILDFKPSAVNTDLPPDLYYYDIEWTYGASIRTIIKGVFQIDGHISN